MVFLRELREFMNVLIEPLLIRSCEFEMDLKKFFCLRSNLSNDDIISA